MGEWVWETSRRYDDTWGARNVVEWNECIGFFFMGKWMYWLYMHHSFFISMRGVYKDAECKKGVIQRSEEKVGAF